MPVRLRNYINGEFIDTLDYFEKFSPVDESILFNVPNSNLNEVSKACKTAEVAFLAWNAIGPVQRGELLFKLASELESHRGMMADRVAMETGKSRKDALGEVGAAVAQCRFMAGEGTRLGGRIIYGHSYGKTVLVERRPYGVAVLLIASNTPIANIVWKACPALICGNTVVLKSSEDAPGTAELFAQIIDKVGIPKGVFNVVHGQGRVVGPSLLEQQNIGVLSFTGSTRVGKGLKQQFSEKSTNVFLEMGGKNPMVIFSDANLENAVKWALLSSFSNAGQRCASSSRILIERPLYEKFKASFVQKVSQLQVGSGDSDDFGPVVNRKQFENILSHVKKAVESDNGKLLYGGERAEKLGFYVQPTVVEGLSINAELSQTEIFGPVTCLYAFEAFDEAVALANNTHYGLTSAVHTRDIDKAMKFSRAVQAGVCSINGGTHGSEAHMPFGGIKDSGNGLREPGVEALDVYSYKMNTVINLG